MSSSEAKQLSDGGQPQSGQKPARRTRQRRAFVPVHPTPCGKYTLIAKIGHGGMAEVFLGVASGMGGFRKLAVVKRIHPQLLEEPEFVQMFLDEARRAARLNHPNVVQTHEVGEHDGVPFIAMEYMEGQAYDKILKAIRRRGDTIPVKLAVRVAMELSVSILKMMIRSSKQLLPMAKAILSWPIAKDELFDSMRMTFATWGEIRPV